LRTRVVKALIVVLAFLLGMGLSLGQAAEPAGPGPAGPRLPPEGVRVISPDPGLPADIRAFTGRWSGVWIDPDHPERGIPEVLIVEEVVSKDEIRVFFSWGDCPVCRSKGAWRRFTGKIARICIDWRKLPEPFSRIRADALGNKKVLCFSYPEGRTFTFVLDDDDQLLGTDGVGAVRMSRMK
jgi:hypothetical protein